MSKPDSKPFRDLSEEECWALTTENYLARLATYDGSEIFVTPINIATHNGKVYFRSAAGSKLTRLLIDKKVTLQFDRTAEDFAYSVNIFGNARLLLSHDELKEVEHLGFFSWIDTKKHEVIEITPRKMTGRHFNLAKTYHK